MCVSACAGNWKNENESEGDFESVCVAVKKRVSSLNERWTVYSIECNGNVFSNLAIFVRKNWNQTRYKNVPLESTAKSSLINVCTQHGHIFSTNNNMTIWTTMYQMLLGKISCTNEWNFEYLNASCLKLFFTQIYWQAYRFWYFCNANVILFE